MESCMEYVCNAKKLKDLKNKDNLKNEDNLKIEDDQKYFYLTFFNKTITTTKTLMGFDTIEINLVSGIY